MTEHKTDDVAALQNLQDAYAKIKSEIGKVIIGQEAVVEQLLIALLARGHCLLVGVPGLAKTLLISTLAQILDLKFSRIQFTPDLMPSDITGTEIIEEDRSTGTRGFKFVRGPVFANIILADEINRTPPKTQAALLQAMQENEVTAAGETYRLDQPFFVLATQNPIEQEGTYPLPEAQLDRFMFNIFVDYPAASEEEEIVMTTTAAPTAKLDKVLTAEQIIELQRMVRTVPIAPEWVSYAVRLARATRPNDPIAPDFVKNWVSWGAGPRAGQFMVLAAKVRAILEGRGTPGPKDIRFAALPVFRHRIVTSFNAEAEGVDTIAITNKLLEAVKEKE